jgi:hypothetical protein
MLQKLLLLTLLLLKEGAGAAAARPDRRIWKPNPKKIASRAHEQDPGQCDRMLLSKIAQNAAQSIHLLYLHNVKLFLGVVIRHHQPNLESPKMWPNPYFFIFNTKLFLGVVIHT